MVEPAKVAEKASEPGALLWFLKERIAPLNATVLFSTTVAGVLDFVFGRASAWLAVIAVVLVMLLLFLICAPHMPAALRPAWLERLGGQAGRRAALLYLGAAAAIFTGAAFASEKQRGNGGAVAAAFPAAAAWQRDLDLLHRDNQQILGAVRGLKQETSANPRKELFNQGMAWSNSAFGEAVRAHDAPSVALYLQGGMPIQMTEAWIVFDDENTELQELMAAHGERFEARQCPELLSRIETDAVLSATRPRRAMLAALCSNATGREAAAGAVADYSSRLATARAEQAQLLEWQAHPARCHAAFMAGKGPAISTRAELDFFTYSDEARVIARQHMAVKRCAGLDSDLSRLGLPFLEKTLQRHVLVQKWIK